MDTANMTEARAVDETTMASLKRLARDEHLSVFGTALSSEMDNEPKGYRPFDLLPGAQGLISFGIAVPQDVYTSPVWHVEAVWRSQNLLYRKLDTISLRIATLLETKGFRSIPIYGCMPLKVNKRGTVVGFINQMRMAEVSGIGVVGKNGLLLNSRFGARLMLGGVITTASLSKDLVPPLPSEPGCPEACRICDTVCPAKAIMPDKKQVKIMRCLRYSARTPLMSNWRFLWLRARDKEAASRYMSMSGIDEHTLQICSACVSRCPYGEEEKNESN